jgi:hypothetical protein
MRARQRRRGQRVDGTIKCTRRRRDIHIKQQFCFGRIAVVVDEKEKKKKKIEKKRAVNAKKKKDFFQNVLQRLLLRCHILEPKHMCVISLIEIGDGAECAFVERGQRIAKRLC